MKKVPLVFNTDIRILDCCQVPASFCIKFVFMKEMKLTSDKCYQKETKSHA